VSKLHFFLLGFFLSFLFFFFLTFSFVAAQSKHRALMES